MTTKGHVPIRFPGRSLAAAMGMLGLLFALIVGTTPSAQAQGFNVIYNFTGGIDGANPHVGVTVDSAGNLYGSAYAGGLGYGAVFKLTHKGAGWVLSPLYSFQGKGANDGAGPDASLVIGKDGSLYGTTIAGGGNQDPYCHIFGGYYGCGTVFNLRPPPTRPATPLTPWDETLVYLFTFDPDGAYPRNNIALDSKGNLYGTGSNGGTVYGVVWRFRPPAGAGASRLSTLSRAWAAPTEERRRAVWPSARTATSTARPRSTETVKTALAPSSS